MVEEQYPDKTDPANMVGQGQWVTVSVRGIPFAPEKREELVKPPRGAEDLGRKAIEHTQD